MKEKYFFYNKEENEKIITDEIKNQLYKVTNLLKLNLNTEL